ncbi:unnamed protein product, partial [Prorocentrum cordatum]
VPKVGRRNVAGLSFEEGSVPKHGRRNKQKDVRHTLVAYLLDYHPTVDDKFMNFVKGHDADIPAPSDLETSWSARQRARFLREVCGPEVPDNGLPDGATWGGMSFIPGLDSDALAATSIATLAEQDPSAPCVDEADAPPLGESPIAWLQPEPGRVAGSARDDPLATGAPTYGAACSD